MSLTAERRMSRTSIRWGLRHGAIVVGFVLRVGYVVAPALLQDCAQGQEPRAGLPKP